MTGNIHQIPVRQHNEDRIRRAESWLRRSRVAEVNRQQAVSDEDKAAFDCEQFIFLWISFNAAYGRELLDYDRDEDNPTESRKFREFLKKKLMQIFGEQSLSHVSTKVPMKKYGKVLISFVAL